MFRIYPAVDIKGGRCVRLFQGKLDKETVFSERPWEMAQHWESQGASYLHVVDLDGASEGRLSNLDALRSIMDKITIPLQFGGGIRSKKDVESLLSLGVERVILGTKALVDPGFLEEMSKAFGESIIVSLDTRGRELAVRAWKERLDKSLEGVLKQLLESRVSRVIHTDISRDGTLKGYNTTALEPLLDTGISVIAAGGISCAEDVKALKGLTARGVEGVIIGRALYTGDIDLTGVLDLEEE
jgi:phosphoribosylformimino-5-aminoimidazole carboxamide ribotide isomerase